MPGHVDLVWEGSGYGSRRSRRAYRYQAYLPDPVAEWDQDLPSGALNAVTVATAALAELNTGGPVADLDALAGPLLRAEALGSSFIEGLRVSHKNLAAAAYAPVAATGTARAVFGNVRAMERAITIASSPHPVSVASLIDIHLVLLEGTSEERFAGKLRQEQNWVGGRASGPAGADFVPPPWQDVRGLLDDLVAFCNRDDLPPILQAAIAHAQFETIHPFSDGNGRAGRCLIHVVLRRRGATPRYSPPVSVVLATNGAAYIQGLTSYRAGDVAQWCGQFADAMAAAARAAERLGRQLADLVDELMGQAGALRSDSVARKILAGLPAHPIVSAATAAQLYDVSDRSSRHALTLLEQRGVLVPTHVGRRRDREWTNDQLFELLDAYEYGLATPAAG